MASRIDPGVYAKAVTASDTVDIDFEGTARATRSLYVGSGGDVSVEFAGTELATTTVIFPSVPTGASLAIGVTRVNLAGTTAGSFVAIW